mgnify:CR=1 FL=1
MDDLQIEFDFLVGKNEVNSTLDGIKKSASSASSSVDSLGKSANKAVKEFGAIKSAGGGIDSIGSGARSSSVGLMAFGGSALAVAGSVAAVVYSAKQFVSAAIESEDNVSRLNVALKQTGLYSDTTSKKFQELASAIQETTVYSDDQAMSLMSTLQNIGQFTEKGLELATKASIELASAMKIDLNTAAMLVGKAAIGNVESFKRYGIEIRKGKTDSETFANTLEELSRLGGSSKAELETLGGASRYLGNQLGELAETAGFAISNIFKLKDAAIFAAKAIKDINSELKEKPKEIAFDVAISAAGQLGLLLKAAKFAYSQLVDEVEKNPLKVRVDAENAISKLPMGTKGIFDLPFEQGKSAPMLESIGKQVEASKELVQARKQDTSEIEKQKEKIKQMLESQMEQIKNAGKTQLEIIEKERSERIKLLKDVYSTGEITTKDALAYRIRIESEFQARKAEIEKKAEDERLKRNKDIEKALGEWINKVSEESKTTLEKLGEKFVKPENFLGFVSNTMQGKEGARSAISGAAGMAADVFAPGTGVIVSQLISQLSQGPEATKAMVKEFADSVPVIIQAIIESIPVLIEELNKQFPKIIETMADMLGDPNFWVNFSKGMLKASIASAQAVPKAFIQAIPEFFDGFGKELINAIVNGISQAVGSVGEGVGDFFGSVWSGVEEVGSWIGLARGGQVQTVPNGFPNDTFPAMLSSGELVVDRSTVERLNDFMDSGQESGGVTDVLLAKILDALSGPQNINTSVNLNGREFASIILELSRSNARLTV